MSTRFSASMEMSKPRRDRTTEPVSRDQVLMRERGQGNIRFHCPSDLKQNDNLTRLILTLAICVTIHTYIISRIIWGGGGGHKPSAQYVF